MTRDGFIEVTGGRVWYQVFNENAGGTPLIVLHGGPGSSCCSLLGLKALSAERPVILYDQLGCGKSDRPADPSLWVLDRFVELIPLNSKRLLRSLTGNSFAGLTHIRNS